MVFPHFPDDDDCNTEQNHQYHDNQNQLEIPGDRLRIYSGVTERAQNASTNLEYVCTESECTELRRD